MRCEDYPELTNWLTNKKFLSHDIINEIVELMAGDVLRAVLEKIKSRDCYAIMCDETCDITGIEQMTICVRSVSDDLDIDEDFLGLYAMDSTDAESIFLNIRDVHIRSGLDINRICGQAYDGASAMAGHISGVAKRFSDIVKEAVFVHCHAHRLNLVLQDLCKSVSHE